jgi:hypothetical protein
MRRFNYTNRLRILQEDVQVHVSHGAGHVPVFDIALDLKDYGLPAEAEIVTEAYQSTRWMRFGLGRVGLITDTRGRELSSFDDVDNLRFRIKVVEPGTGKLLALAQGVTPYSPDEEADRSQTSILPVRSTDLRESGVCWKVEYGEQDVTLLIEKGLGGKEQVVRSPLFKGLILPNVMREILSSLVASNDWDAEAEDIFDWRSKWLRFVRLLGGGIPKKEEGADNEDWVDDAVRRLVAKMGSRDQFVLGFEEDYL